MIDDSTDVSGSVSDESRILSAASLRALSHDRLSTAPCGRRAGNTAVVTEVFFLATRGNNEPLPHPKTNLDETQGEIFTSSAVFSWADLKHEEELICVTFLAEHKKFITHYNRLVKKYKDFL